MRDFLILAAKEVGISIEFRGKGLNEVGIVREITGNKAKKVRKGQKIVQVHSDFYRPTEVETLLSNPELASTELGWKPKISLNTLCREMIESDYNLLVKEISTDF